MPSTPTVDIDLSLLSPIAQSALRSLPLPYARILLRYPLASLSPLQLALFSAYVVKSAQKFSTLSDVQKKALTQRSAAIPGVM